LGVASLQNKMHINDWSSIQTLFDRLNKQLEKIMKTAPGLGVPRVYARILAELEDFLVKSLADKAARKKVRIVAA
jgi:translation initiation factor 3 subunit C